MTPLNVQKNAQMFKAQIAHLTHSYGMLSPKASVNYEIIRRKVWYFHFSNHGQQILF